MLLLFSCTVTLCAEAPTKKSEQLKPGYVYKLDSGDIVAISSVDANTGSRDSVLHVVQTDGTLHLPFAKVKARGKTIAEIRDALKPLSDEMKQHGLVDVVATIVDLRNSDNDHILQNLR